MKKKLTRHFFTLVLLMGGLSGCSLLPYEYPDFHAGYVQVRKGETLYSIAWRFDLDYHQLASWNDLQPPYDLTPGQWLRMNPPVHQLFKPGRQQVVTRAAINGKAHPYKETAIPAARPIPNTVNPASGRSIPTHSPRFIWPSRGKLLNTFSKLSQGIEIAGKLGQPVLAAATGQVVYSGAGLPSYGNLVIIKHNGSYLSAYGHNQRILVKEGDTVRKGQEIALMGMSGTDINRPELFFEIRVDGDPKNPLLYLPSNTVN